MSGYQIIQRFHSTIQSLESEFITVQINHTSKPFEYKLTNQEWHMLRNYRKSQYNNCIPPTHSNDQCQLRPDSLSRTKPEWLTVWNQFVWPTVLFAMLYKFICICFSDNTSGTCGICVRHMRQFQPIQSSHIANIDLLA